MEKRGLNLTGYNANKAFDKILPSFGLFQTRIRIGEISLNSLKLFFLDSN